jgi:hypothetical protein
MMAIQMVIDGGHIFRELLKKGKKETGLACKEFDNIDKGA